jgi:hypothetical protein
MMASAEMDNSTGHRRATRRHGASISTLQHRGDVDHRFHVFSLQSLQSSAMRLAPFRRNQHRRSEPDGIQPSKQSAGSSETSVPISQNTSHSRKQSLTVHCRENLLPAHECLRRCLTIHF